MKNKDKIIKKQGEYISRLIEMIDTNQELSDETFEERVEIESDLSALQESSKEEEPVPDEIIGKWARGTITDDLSDIKTKFDVEFIKEAIIKAKIAGAEAMREGKIK